MAVRKTFIAKLASTESSTREKRKLEDDSSQTLDSNKRYIIDLAGDSTGNDINNDGHEI